MTVEDTSNKIQYTGDGVFTGPYPFTFQTEEEWIEVFVASILVSNTTYTLTINGDQDVSPGGRVDFDVAVADQDSIVILRTAPITQESDYTAFDAFPAERAESDFDKGAIIDQQLNEVLSRAIVLSVDATQETVLPEAVALGYWRWNASASEVEYAGAPGVVVPSESFGSVTDMVTSSSLVEGDVVLTLGYNSSGDGGDNLYLAQANTGGPYDNWSLINSIGNPGIEFVGLFPGGEHNPKQAGALGDDVDDTDALAVVFASNGGSRLLPGEYKVVSTTDISNTTLRGDVGAVIKSDINTEALKPFGRVVIDSVEFNNFKRALFNENPADPAIQLRVTGCEFSGAPNYSIFLSVPSEKIVIDGNYFNQNEDQMIRLGENVFASQDSYLAPTIINNTFVGTPATSVSSTAAALTYTVFGKMIGNHAEDIQGDPGAEVWGYYTKSRYGIIALNTLNGLSNGSSPVGINLKGSERGETSSPNGYGTMALGNHVIGSNIGTGIQGEIESCAIIANLIENFPRGVEQGSGPSSDSIIVANRFRGEATAGERAVSVGSITGSRVMCSNNTTHNYENGINYSAGSSLTIDLILLTDNITEGSTNAAGTGLNVETATDGNITNVLVSDTQIKTYLDGMRIRGVDGGTLSNITFDDIGNSLAPLRFDGSHHLIARNFNRVTTTTTDTTVTPVFEIPIETNGTILTIKMRSVVKQGAVGSSSTDEAVHTKECIAKRDGGTVSIIQSSTSDILGSGAAASTAFIIFNVSGDNVQCSVRGDSATTYNWLSTFDFEIL